LSKHLLHESVFFVATSILDVSQFVMISELVLQNFDCSLECVFLCCYFSLSTFHP